MNTYTYKNILQLSEVDPQHISITFLPVKKTKIIRLVKDPEYIYKLQKTQIKTCFNAYDYIDRFKENETELHNIEIRKLAFRYFNQNIY
jgi:hypothetical protein